MANLTPAPSQMGNASPALGPWFSDNSLTIPAPAADLSCTLAMPAASLWLPPAGGTLGLYVAAATPPKGLAHLRDAAGAPPFAPGRLVALFRLLPDVEERLHALMAAIPSADGATVTVPTRARVRFLAMELTAVPATLATLNTLIRPALTGTDAERAAAVGLRLDADGSTLLSGAVPMAQLRRPGSVSDADRALLNFAGATGVRLWAFDAGGRAIDPGAVAAWYAHLSTSFTNLWESGLAAADQRTAPVADQLTIHLTNAHEGPLTGSAIFGRLEFTGADYTTLDAAGLVRVRGATAAADSIRFTAAPTVDDAPEPRIAMLPHGSYGDTLALWSDPAAAALQRDFVRVAVLDVEVHLVGQSRVAPGGASAVVTRRAADQARTSTRVGVHRTQGPALLSTTDLAITAVSTVVGSGTGAHLVTSVLERDWAGLSPVSDLPDEAAPDSLGAMTVRALTGGGAEQSGTAKDQRVLVEWALGSELAGAWVRAWPQGFDATKGRHTRMDGGGGIVRATGDVSLVVTLPDGSLIPNAPLGLDLLVITAQSSRMYTDQRFDRPTPLGGAPVALSAVAGGTELLVCESGELFSNPTDLVDLPSGATVLVRTGTPALLDPTSVPAANLSAGAIIRNLSAGDQVRLTEPAFVKQPTGHDSTVLASSGATVQQHVRSGLSRLFEAGAPLPSMERLEIVGARVDTTAPATAAVAATPALSRYHELMTHQAGHPGAPGATEIHGTGVQLTGPAAVAVAEFTRDRTAGSTIALAQAASTPFGAQTAPTAPSPWAAVLRTVAAGVEAEFDPALLSDLLGAANPYPFGGSLTSIKTWLQDQGISLPASVDAAAESVVRALDRRMLTAARGAREGVTSLIAAIGRAEDFVYIETPAFDDTSLGEAGDELALWGALKQRLSDRPALRVLVCVPVQHMPGMPKPLGRVRDTLVREAVASLRAAGTATTPAEERIAFFCPRTGPGRSLRLAATTVIVDDAYAQTGTTHLWRRGLTFDASLAVALFDDSLSDGRPAEVRAFRRQLVAERLGLEVGQIPLDPAEMVAAVRAMTLRHGSGRLSVEAIGAPDPAPSGTDRALWNIDGSQLDISDPLGWLLADTEGVLGGEVVP